MKANACLDFDEIIRTNNFFDIFGEIFHQNATKFVFEPQTEFRFP